MLKSLKRLALWLGLVENDQQCTDCYAVGDEAHAYDCMTQWEPCVNINPDGCPACNVGENQRCWSLACVDYDPNCNCAYCAAGRLEY